MSISALYLSKNPRYRSIPIHTNRFPVPRNIEQKSHKSPVVFFVSSISVITDPVIKRRSLIQIRTYLKLNALLNMGSILLGKFNFNSFWFIVIFLTYHKLRNCHISLNVSWIFKRTLNIRLVSAPNFCALDSALQHNIRDTKQTIITAKLSNRTLK